MTTLVSICHVIVQIHYTLIDGRVNHTSQRIDQSFQLFNNQLLLHGAHVTPLWRGVLNGAHGLA